MPKNVKQARKPFMMLKIEFYEDDTREFSMTQDHPIGLAQVEQACDSAVLWVQREYDKQAAFDAAKQREKAAIKAAADVEEVEEGKIHIHLPDGSILNEKELEHVR